MPAWNNEIQKTNLCLSGNSSFVFVFCFFSPLMKWNHHLELERARGGHPAVWWWPLITPWLIGKSFECQEDTYAWVTEQHCLPRCFPCGPETTWNNKRRRALNLRTQRPLKNLNPTLCRWMLHVQEQTPARISSCTRHNKNNLPCVWRWGQVIALLSN